MSRKFTKSLACVGMAGMLISGCVSEFENLSDYRLATWEPRFAVPVFDESLGLKNIVGNNVSDSRFSTDPQGKFVFTYHQQFSTASANSVISLGSQLVSATIPSPGTAPTQTSFAANGVYNFAVTTGQELTKANLSKGSLGLTFRSTFKQSIGVTIELPSVSKNGAPWTSAEYVLPRATTTQVTLQAALDMAGMNILLNTIESQPYNKLPFKIIVRFIGPTTNVTASDALQVEMAMQDLGYAYLEGYMGNVAFVDKEKDDISVDLFATNSIGSIHFTDPQVEVRIDNSFGIGARATVENLIATTRSDEEIKLRGSGIEALKNFVVAPATAQKPVAVTNTGTLNKSTVDNMLEVFNKAPRKFEYTYSLYSLPETNTEARRKQFVHDTSSVVLHTTIKLPAEGRITNYAITDTLNSILPEQTDKVLKDALIRLVVTNGFPVDLDMKVIFIDEFDQKIDSIGSSGNQTHAFITGGAPDANGRVDQTKLTPQIVDIPVSGARYKRMAEKGKRIIVYAGLKTTGANEGKNVAFYDDYRIRVQLGAQVKLSVGL